MTQPRRTGFYLAAAFEPHTKPIVMFLHLNEKPFEIDPVEGIVSTKCICAIPRNFFADKWFFFEGHKISDIDKDKDLRKRIQYIMDDWCKEAKRKPFQLFKED